MMIHIQVLLFGATNQNCSMSYEHGIHLVLLRGGIERLTDDVQKNIIICLLRIKRPFTF